MLIAADVDSSFTRWELRNKTTLGRLGHFSKCTSLVFSYKAKLEDHTTRTADVFSDEEENIFSLFRAHCPLFPDTINPGHASCTAG